VERNPRRCEDGGWLQSLMGARRGISESSSGMDASFLRFAARVTRTASSVWMSVLDLAQSTAAELAGRLTIGVTPCEGAQSRPRGTCTQQ
jgi:hypothetical protein